LAGETLPGQTPGRGLRLAPPTPEEP
jgi:hypothetical protein